MRITSQVVWSIVLLFGVCHHAPSQGPSKARPNAAPVAPQTETIEGLIADARGVALPGMGETVTAFYMSSGDGLKRIVVRLTGNASSPRTTVLRGLDELPASKIEGELNSPGRHVVVTHDVTPYPGADAYLATRVLLGFAELAEGTVTLTDLKTIDLAIGSGDEAAKGQTVTVHYAGWLANGKLFDTSRDNGAPFEVPLGKNRLIKGWEMGIPGMRVGGRRRLLVPSRLGYGVRGAGNTIPPNAVLVFDIELIGVR